MFNLLSNLFCSFFYTSTFRSMKKEQNKFDNKLNIKDARCVYLVPNNLVGIILTCVAILDGVRNKDSGG